LARAKDRVEVLTMDISSLRRRMEKVKLEIETLYQEKQCLLRSIRDQEAITKSLHIKLNKG